MKKKWILKPAAPEDYFKDHSDHPKNLMQLLFHRGLKTTAEVADFLRPVYGQEVYDPFVLKDMKEGVGRMMQALEKSEKITVYADYDADAVTAAAVMIRTLKALGANVNYYIPDRFAEGYGVNSQAIEEIAKKGTALIITVDCGVTSVAEVDVARSLGVDVIITDHHHVPEVLPKAVAVINPHRSDSEYSFRDLTGVGVAFKFVQALLTTLRQAQGNLPVPEGWEKWLLDFVAIGTVADCQSLMGENRVLVHYGLQVLNKTRWPGLKALLALSNTSLSKGLNAGTIGFQVAPRINAAGRLAHASTALNLLLTDDPLEAASLAETLEKLNRQRQQLTETIISEAREQVEKQLSSNKVLLAYAKDWPKGVVGLVAGKLTEEFYRPTLVATQDDIFSTGSARSIPGFSIVEAFTYAGEHAERFGGHDAAAGFTVRNEKLEDFYKAIAGYADVEIKDEMLNPVTMLDAELIDSSDFSVDYASGVENLQPFGLGNPRPLFLIRNLKVVDTKAVGAEGKHVQLSLRHPAVSALLKTIAFNQGYLVKALKPDDTIDIVAELLLDEWNGNKRVQLRLIDWDRVEEV